MSLTRAEVEALPEGTRVVVTWSGGNGPHVYRITRRLGDVSVDTDPPSYAHSLGYVGEKPSTTVDLAEDT